MQLEDKQEAKKLLDRALKYKTAYKTDLECQLDQLSQRKTEQKVKKITEEKQVKPIEFEAYQRDQMMKQKALETSAYLKQQMNLDSSRKLKETEDRKQPPERHVTSIDLELDKQKEEDRKARIWQQRADDTKEQMRRHAEKLKAEKLVKEAEKNAFNQTNVPYELIDSMVSETSRRSRQDREKAVATDVQKAIRDELNHRDVKRVQLTLECKQLASARYSSSKNINSEKLLRSSNSKEIPHRGFDFDHYLRGNSRKTTQLQLSKDLVSQRKSDLQK